MSGNPLVLRERAQRDIDEAVGHYLAESGIPLAPEFIDALEEACRRIGERPVSGSPRYAHELDIPGLRFHAVRRFPYLVFYVEREAGSMSGVSCMGHRIFRPDCRSRARVTPKGRWRRHKGWWAI